MTITNIEKTITFSQLKNIYAKLPAIIDDHDVKEIGLPALIIRGQYAQLVADSIINEIVKDQAIEIPYNHEGLTDKMWDRFAAPAVKEAINKLPLVKDDNEQNIVLTNMLFEMHEFLTKLEIRVRFDLANPENKSDDELQDQFNDLLEKGHDWIIRRLQHNQILTDSEADFTKLKQEDGYTFFDKGITLKLTA